MCCHLGIFRPNREAFSVCVHVCVLDQGSYDHGDEQQSANLHRKPSCGLNSIINLEFLIKAYSKYLPHSHLRDCFVLGGQRPLTASDTSDLFWNRMLNPLAERKITSFHQPVYIH